VNRWQRAIAQATGINEWVESQEKDKVELKSALEEVQTSYSKLERYLEDVDYLNLFDPYYGQDQDILPAAKRKQTITRIRRLRHENPIAKQGVRLAVRFTFGRGISYIINDRKPKRIIDSFWNDPVNEAVYTSHMAMKDRFDETLTDGEKFFELFSTPRVPPYVRLSECPMEEIVDIVDHPRNRDLPLFYKRVYREYKYDATASNNMGLYVPSSNEPKTRYYRDFHITEEEWEDIKAEGYISIPEGLIAKDDDGNPILMKHRMLNPVRMKIGRRGISELFASREWFRVFKEFMEDRGAINAAANAFSYVRESKGGPAAVAKMSGQLGGLQTPGDENQPGVPSLRRLTKPVAGAIYDVNQNVNLKPIRADTGAVHAKEDARLILMAGGAGMGTSIHYFGEGGDANLATAQAMELPMVKGYEDYQKFHEEEFIELTQFVYRVAVDNPQAKPFEIAFDWPPIITQDVVKWTTAYGQLVQQIGSTGNRKLKEIGIRGALYTLDVPNVDTVMPEIMDEEERIFEEKEEQRQQMLEVQAGQQNPQPSGAAALKAATAGDGKNGRPPASAGGNGRQEGQRATDGGSVNPLGPDLKRIANGKRPRQPATGPRSRVN
jgi:hypothetical protein